MNNELKKLFPADLYDMWFDGLECAEQSDSKIVLCAPNEFNAIWIENNYLDVIAQQARAFAGAPVSIVIEVAADEPVETTASASTNRMESRLESKSAAPARQLSHVVVVA